MLYANIESVHLFKQIRSVTLPRVYINKHIIVITHYTLTSRLRPFSLLSSERAHRANRNLRDCCYRQYRCSCYSDCIYRSSCRRNRSRSSWSPHFALRSGSICPWASSWCSTLPTGLSSPASPTWRSARVLTSSRDAPRDFSRGAMIEWLPGIQLSMMRRDRMWCCSRPIEWGLCLVGWDPVAGWSLWGTGWSNSRRDRIAGRTWKMIYSNEGYFYFDSKSMEIANLDLTKVFHLAFSRSINTPSISSKCSSLS